MSESAKHTTGTDTGEGESAYAEATQDRGWAWVVAFAGMVALFLGIGVYKTLGLLMVELMDVYETTTTEVALILMCSGIGYCVTGLLLMFGIGDIVHERALLVLAGLLSSLGFITTYFSTKFEEVFILGICTGAAMQIGYASSTSIVGKYFKKRLALGSGLAMAGVSLGTLVLPPFVRWLFDEFTYRGAALIMAGISLNTLVSGALMRPKQLAGKDKTGEKRNISKSYQLKKVQTPDDAPLNLSSNSAAARGYSNDGFVAETEKRIYMGDNPVATGPNDAFRVESKGTNRNIRLELNTIIAKESEQSHALCCKSFGILARDFVIVQPKYRSKRDSRWENITFGFSFFKDASFVFFQFFIYFSTVGCECLIQFYPAITQELGLSNYQSAFLLSIVGGADLVSRIIFGLIGDCCVLERSKLVMLPLFILGFACFLSHFAVAFWSQAIFAIVIGFTNGVAYSFRGVLLIDLFGLPTLLRRIGVSNFITGFAFATAGPILGSIRDSAGDYGLPVKIIGAVFICSGLSLLFIDLRKRCRSS